MVETPVRVGERASQPASQPASEPRSERAGRSVFTPCSARRRHVPFAGRSVCFHFHRRPDSGSGRCSVGPWLVYLQNNLQCTRDAAGPRGTRVARGNCSDRGGHQTRVPAAAGRGVARHAAGLLREPQLDHAGRGTSLYRKGSLSLVVGGLRAIGCRRPCSWFRSITATIAALVSPKAPVAL